LIASPSSITYFERLQMKISKRGIGAVVAGAVVASVLAVGTPAHASANAITIWADTGAKTVIQNLIQKWGADNGITITIVGKDFGKVRDILKTAVNNGNGPDILAAAPHDWTGNLVNSGVLKPVSLSVASKRGVSSASLAAFTINSNGSNKLYGAPGWMENIGFFRNIKLAKTHPATWAAIKNGELNIPYSSGNDPYHFYPVQTGYGAPVFTSTNGVWNAALGMGGTKGAAFATLLKDKGTAYFGKPSDNAVCNFVTGKVKYLVTGPWNLAAIENGTTGCTKGLKYGKDFVIEAFPKGPAGASTPFLGVRGFFETKQVDASANSVAVTKLLNYVTGPAAGKYFLANFNKQPANLVANKLTAGRADLAGFAAAGKGAMAMPNIPAMDKVWSDWGNVEGNILAGKSADATGDWAKMVDKITATIG
jgi:arabinogalactan oligomer/maltooligosaccharide transport system substrate-binding protein